MANEWMGKDDQGDTIQAFHSPMCRCRVSHYLAQDGMTFSIFFGGDRPSVEYEADSLEENAHPRSI